MEKAIYQILIKGEVVATFNSLYNMESCADEMKELRAENNITCGADTYGNTPSVDFHASCAGDSDIIIYWVKKDEMQENRRARIARRIYGKMESATKPRKARYKMAYWRPVRRDGMSDQLWANIQHLTSKECKNILQRYADIKRYAKPIAV